MRICALPILMAAAIAMIGAGAAHAQSGPTCGAFSLVGTDKKFSVVDNAPVGKSLGDVRVGSRVLVGKDGKRAGEVHFVATLTGISPRDVLASKYFVMFADGWIAADSVYALPDAGDTSQKAGDAVLLVTGGTGAFANANGTITIKAGEQPTYVFDLSCK